MDAFNAANVRCFPTTASKSAKHYRVVAVGYHPQVPDLVLTLGSGTVVVPSDTTSAKLVAITVYSWLLVDAAPWKATVSFLDDHQHGVIVVNELS